MKPTLILPLLTTLALAFPAAAQNVEPATHLWLYANTSMVYVPAATKEGCMVLVQQAALLNSSTGHCYMKDQFLQEIKCQKSQQQGGLPGCTTSNKSTR